MAESDSTETRRMLDRVKSGDRAAREQLFERHQAYLRKMIRIRLGKELRARLDPSDVIQETQVDALRRLDEFVARRPMSFRLWLRKTAFQRLAKLRERHIEAARRSVRREMFLSDRSSLDLARRLVDSSASPSQHLARDERARQVHAALAGLGDLDREILLMRYVEKLAFEAIAQVLDLESAAVQKRHVRALLKLQKIMESHGLGGEQGTGDS